MRRAPIRVAMVAAAVFVASVAVGCDRSSKDAPPGNGRDTISISGSGSATPLIDLLVEAYPVDEIEFSYLRGLHTRESALGVAGGEFDIGLVARRLGDGEYVEDIEYRPLALDALALVTHPTAGLRELTSQQVLDIYEGRVSSWAELGGSDTVIAVLDRGESESAKLALREHLLGEAEVTPAAAVLAYEEDMAAGVANTPGAIGYLSLGRVLEEGLDVTVLAIDGVEPSVESVGSGAYGIVRVLGIVVRRDAPSHVRRFIEWAVGPEAGEILMAAGFSPYSGEVAAE